MKKIFFYSAFALLFSASACQKCYECKQYCAYCETSTGVRTKICATKDVNHFQIDSTLNALKGLGYTCNLLNTDKSVCDRSDKINDATNYYAKQDYYCNAK